MTEEKWQQLLHKAGLGVRWSTLKKSDNDYKTDSALRQYRELLEAYSWWLRDEADDCNKADAVIEVLKSLYRPLPGNGETWWYWYREEYWKRIDCRSNIPDRIFNLLLGQRSSGEVTDDTIRWYKSFHNAMTDLINAWAKTEQGNHYEI